MPDQITGCTMLLSRLPENSLPPRAILLANDVMLVLLSPETNLKDRFFSERKPPYGTVSVQAASGAHQIAAVRLCESHASIEHSLLALTASSIEELAGANLSDAIVLGSDIAELADELDTPSQKRLLAFLLGFCGKAFSLVDHSDFASACLQLARLCTPSFSMVEPVATVTGSWTVFAGLPDLGDTSVFVLNQTCVRRSAALAIKGSSAMHLVEQVASGDVLLVQGEHPGLFPVSAKRQGTPELLRNAHDPTGLRAACLQTLVPLCPRVTGRLREMALVTPAMPRRHDDVSQPIGAGLEAALPDGEGNLFLRGWMRDPMDLVEVIELAGLYGVAPLGSGNLHWFRRPDIDKHFATAAFAGREARTGFVAFVRDPCGGHSVQPALSLRLRSGSRVEVRPPLRSPHSTTARTAVLASVPLDEVTDAMLDDCLGPAAASFHRSSLAVRGTPVVIQIGMRLASPVVSIIVPLYRNLSFLRFQIAAFARDSECRAVELIFVLDSPEQAREVEHLLRGLHAMYALPVTLVVLARNVGYAAANNAGAAVARGRLLLLLNSDVVSAGPPWLGTLIAGLEQDNVGAVGPKLLFDDDSIQHAGLFFQRDLDGLWLNSHYHKGMPRLWPAASKSRRVPGVTGAALLVHRHLFEAVGGICEDYIVGDYEDSDFCLRLHTMGNRTVYVPSVELYHFERRSISLHKGYNGTLACRYNRRLHHHRWDDTIGALMAEPEFSSAGAFA